MNEGARRILEQTLIEVIEQSGISHVKRQNRLLAYAVFILAGISVSTTIAMFGYQNQLSDLKKTSLTAENLVKPPNTYTWLFHDGTSMTINLPS